MDAVAPATGYPPGPPAHGWKLWRTARSIRQIAADPLGFVGRRFAEFGDTYHVDEGGGRHLYVTRHPDRMREVLVERAVDYQKAGGANDRLVPVLGDGLLTADGESWKRQRTLIQPRFHAKAIAGYGATMVEHAEAVALTDGEVVDVSALMMALTLRIVTKALFDHDVRSETDDVARSMEAFRDLTQLSLLPEWIPTPSRVRGRRAIGELDAIIARMVEERRRDGLREDLLSMLLDVGLEPALVRDDVVTLFLAGHETTSHALSWTWWLLSGHPEAEARLHEELARVLGDRPPTVADVERLPYVAAVVSEAMRLFPPAFTVARVATRPTRLGDWEVQPGSQVMCWLYHAHHDGRWFVDPEAFRPERFLEPVHPKHAYLPFGAGTRMCIGAGFAKMELSLIVASLARRYRFLRTSADQRVRPKARITLSPDGGLPLRVARR
ncbi:MAG: cytochrome P450 [Alphaproteobacteria bacterium]|nr:cytochrome P450 [Alphaproteobacteria bacterium]MCB9695864.1 cytochrome P450 [Alphaproteobacteria bacterium]